MKPRTFKVKATNRKRVGMGIVARIDAIAAAALDSSAKSLLIMLAKHLRTETAGAGGVAWPSLKTLASQAGMSEDTASRTMARLERSGIVVTVSKAAQGRSARRAIDWAALASSAPRMRVQESNLLKGQRSEDAGSSAPRMRVLDSASSEMQNPEARGGSVQVSVKESVQESVHAAREATTGPLSEDQPTESHTMPPDDLLTGSRPKTDTDPIDNDGDKTHPPEASAPSLPSTDDTASATTPATAQPSLAAPSVVAPDEGQGTVGAFTLAPPTKAKRKAKTAPPLDLDAWGLACQAYDTIAGKTRRWDPARGDGRLIAETMAAQGQARIVARFAQAARDPWCLDKRPDVSALCRAGSDFVRKLDAAAEQVALDAETASDASQAVGGVVGRLEPQNRSQGQAAPKQSGSGAWDDMLSVIRSTGGMRLSLGLRGSTLSHDPTEHARRCRAVADIGGWAKLCELNDFNRMAIRAQWIGAYDRVGVTA